MISIRAERLPRLRRRLTRKGRQRPPRGVWRLRAMRDFSFCIDRGGTFTDVFAAVC